MAPEDTKRPPSEGPDQRLRVDAGKVDVARLRLAAIDRTVFATAERHGTEEHDRRIAETVTGLLDNG